MARNTLVGSFMTPLGEGETNMLDEELKEIALRPDTNLETALRVFDDGGHSELPVVDSRDETKLIGWASQVAALRVYNNALVDMSVEEHK